jgi:hypothetical protein
MVDSLIGRIRGRIGEGRPNEYPGEWAPVGPPVGPGDVAAAEGQLGFRLPDLLRRMYIEVGNGGYGPGFGLVRLGVPPRVGLPPEEAEFDLIGLYRSLVRRYTGSARGEWPAGLVPAFYFGCTVFEFVDGRDPAGPVVGFDQGTEELALALSGERVVAPSLEARLESWLAGESSEW